MNTPRVAAFLLANVLAAGAALAQTVLPVEFRQTEIPFNLQSQRGVPISAIAGNPPGSDGRMPGFNSSQGSTLVPTTNQFRGLTAFGGIPGLTQAGWLRASLSPALQAGTTPFNGNVAADMGLPRVVSNGVVTVVLRRAQIAAPYVSRLVSYAFGAEIPVPLTDERGILLTNVSPQAYWLPQPVTNGLTHPGFYWSPHAEKVYAVQPGPLSIRWLKAEYSRTAPPDYATNPENYYTNGGNYFRIHTVQYTISGSPVKPARKMYWTERDFRRLGKPVAIPASLVGAVQIVYNNNVPATVDEEYVSPGGTPPRTNALQELKTFWYNRDEGYLYAYNREGRVFVELLGDSRSDGRRVQLGYEIVDILREPYPTDATVELGERVVPPGGGSVDELTPEPVPQLAGTPFDYRHNILGSSSLSLYAIKETRNLNDYLVHWMEAGEVGIRWSSIFARYRMVWPSDAAKYSHYLRPLVATEAEAMQTAIPLPTDNAPTIQYQDPLDRPRAKFTPTLGFYTFLDRTYPAHRTLLLYNSGENIAFERVFSWLDETLKSSAFASVPAVTNLTAWNPATGRLLWSDELAAPRIVDATVEVGRRILAPNREAGGDGNGDYLAGHIREEVGTSFNTHAYADPFTAGFEVANLGSIIPVNAIPGRDRLEVWWFRRNGADTSRGFRTIQWPAVIGRYSLRWPVNPREIVLASRQGNDAEGPLDPYEASGAVYYQNDPALPGYNPNEEHAIVSGGSVYATRDDLNITTGAGYSSAPFVLLEYEDADGRPSMSAFKVLREKPSAGWVFDYIVEAGRRLEPPMPLPLLGQPVEAAGGAVVNYNSEPQRPGGDFPGAWDPVRDRTNQYAFYDRFTYRDRKDEFWVYRGPHAGPPPLRAGTYRPATRTIDPPAAATAVIGSPFEYTFHASRQDEFLQMEKAGNFPAWLAVSGLRVAGTPPAGSASTTVTVVIRDLYLGDTVTNNLALTVVASGAPIAQAPLAISSTNTYTGSIVTFSNRPPFLAHSPAPSNSFTMRYYYRTEPSFAWPGFAAPPAPGTIVPYLLPLTNGVSAGDPTSKTTPSLDIVYRPVWPQRDPKDSSKPLASLPYGLTLMTPREGLPGIRDWKTARVLYQQSIAANITNADPSVVLHDPTREKVSDLAAQGLASLPPSVHAQVYQGKYFFPNLPPHLASRVFYDPNRGTNGSLVLAGQLKDELFGEDYLLLNILRGPDLARVRELCTTNDTQIFNKWNQLVDALGTTLQTLVENPAVPGTYIPGTGLDVRVRAPELALVANDNTPVDSYALSVVGPGAGYITLLEGGGSARTQPGDSVAMHVLRVVPDLVRGEIKVLTSDNPLSEEVTFQHSADLAGRSDQYEYEWKIAAPVNGQPPVVDDEMSRYLSLASGADVPRYVLGGSGIRVLGDNYVVLRYRPTDPSHPLFGRWSEWTRPQLAEGWIKRVLAGINPFNQRIRDLFNNQVNTDASILTQAGRRWEGDIALNLDTINNYGLIEIYETVLRRGRSISIEAGHNYGPANDALLLAAGYLNDLYMMLGNEAWADAANPTIGIGTADNTYGDIATALFAFRGQTASLLEEELALLRGRDDFLVPGVELAPVYNRLVWNYTRGIDAGEVIYAINYNIQENPNRDPDGIINAEDAAHMFPQGHGDAYGHYLTALKGYFSLLMNSSFDWVPRSEAVLVLGQPVSVDYQDERKFAAAAAALARAGRQVFDLTWRQDYQAVDQVGWQHFAASRANEQRRFTNGPALENSTRYWGLDHWASRVGLGNYVDWVVGNAILPAVDTAHEGIQKIDRTTVPELGEVALAAGGLQRAMDSADSGLNPLGLSGNTMALDLNPLSIANGPNTHFDQIYQRAKMALNNAVAAFDDAKDVTRLMRSEQDSLAGLQNEVAQQELAYENALIELYGTPYTDDIGPGKTWKQGYAGPDLIHYMYVDLPERTFTNLWNYMGGATSFQVDIQDFPRDWATNYFLTNLNVVSASSSSYQEGTHYLTFDVGPHGFGLKPGTWTGRRASPGQIQQAISQVISSHTALRQALFDQAGLKAGLDRSIGLFLARRNDYDRIQGIEAGLLAADQTLEAVQATTEVIERVLDSAQQTIDTMEGVAQLALPNSVIVGLANGGDLSAPARMAIRLAGGTVEEVFDKKKFVGFTVAKALEVATSTARRWTEFGAVAPIEWNQELRSAIAELGADFEKLQAQLGVINERFREHNDALDAYRALVAQGDRIQKERLIFRQRASAVVQGYRTRDAAFRIFRNEKLERYKTLFDLAAGYAFLAAQAYDYETGLLGSAAGRRFLNRIVASRALGVVTDSEPQFAGSNTGDPGLSSALAEMKADWEVLRGRLGFNNPDAYGTTVSLRTENFRILPGTDSDPVWKDVMQHGRVEDLLADADVRRYCRQISRGDGLPVPGIVIEFATTIAHGHNLFGQPLAAGDHSFSPSAFATKIFGVGVALEGYRGMDDPNANGGDGGSSPADPDSSFLDPLALAATPYVYLIPVGVDSMRSPPLGDASTIRTWTVDDLAIPLPFNIGASDFAAGGKYLSSDSLTEPMFGIRKHQAFRPVSSANVFGSLVVYWTGGELERSQYTNTRLLGRSAWNSRWKLIIPGHALLNDPEEGLNRFIQSVRDIKLYFMTYSYSGN